MIRPDDSCELRWRVHVHVCRHRKKRRIETQIEWMILDCRNKSCCRRSHAVTPRFSFVSVELIPSHRNMPLVTDNLLVSWCFEPSQSQRMTSGLGHWWAIYSNRNTCLTKSAKKIVVSSRIWLHLCSLFVCFGGQRVTSGSREGLCTH